MKKEIAQHAPEKRTVNDFAHRMTVSLTEQDFTEYAMAHSKDRIKKGRQRAILWAVLFTVLGCVAIYRGALVEQGWLADIYLVAGVVMIVFQIFNLFYNYVMFPIALKNSVSKELKKDPSMLMPVEYAFEPDKIVSFVGGKHRTTVLVIDISAVEQLQNILVICAKDGRRLILPLKAVQDADPVIREQLQKLSSEKMRG